MFLYCRQLDKGFSIIRPTTTVAKRTDPDDQWAVPFDPPYPSEPLTHPSVNPMNSNFAPSSSPFPEFDGPIVALGDQAKQRSIHGRDRDLNEYVRSKPQFAVGTGRLTADCSSAGTSVER